MEKLLPVLEKYGVWIFGFCLGAYFLIWHWWPYWKEQDAEERKARREREAKLITMQEVSIKEMTNALQAGTRQSERIADHMDALTEEIRRQ